MCVFNRDATNLTIVSHHGSDIRLRKGIIVESERKLWANKAFKPKIFRDPRIATPCVCDFDVSILGVESQCVPRNQREWSLSSWNQTIKYLIHASKFCRDIEVLVIIIVDCKIRCVPRELCW